MDFSCQRDVEQGDGRRADGILRQIVPVLSPMRPSAPPPLIDFEVDSPGISSKTPKS